MKKKSIESLIADEDPKNLIDPVKFLEEFEWRSKSSDIASRLLDYLDENPNLTHRGLAQKTGLSEPTIHKILKGGYYIKLSTIGKLEKALGVELVGVE